MTVHDLADRSIGLSYTPWQLPTSSRMSFHSEHATWQALQPIQAETSMSLAISTVCRACGAGVVVAERCLMSSDCSAITVSLCLFHVPQARPVFPRLGVRVTDDRGQGAGDEAR